LKIGQYLAMDKSLRLAVMGHHVEFDC